RGQRRAEPLQEGSDVEGHRSTESLVGQDVIRIKHGRPPPSLQADFPGGPRGRSGPRGSPGASALATCRGRTPERPASAPPEAERPRARGGVADHEPAEVANPRPSGPGSSAGGWGPSPEPGGGGPPSASDGGSASRRSPEPGPGPRR